MTDARDYDGTAQSADDAAAQNRQTKHLFAPPPLRNADDTGGGGARNTHSARNH